MVAQVWRDGRKQVDLARFLPGMEVDPLDDGAAKKAGELLRAGGTSDLVDAHAALLAEPDDRVLTSDVADIKALLRTRRVKATVIGVIRSARGAAQIRRGGTGQGQVDSLRTNLGSDEQHGGDQRPGQIGDFF